MHAIWNKIDGFEQKLVGLTRVIKKKQLALRFGTWSAEKKVANEEGGQSKKTETCQTEEGIHNANGYDSRSVEYWWKRSRYC